MGIDPRLLDLLGLTATAFSVCMWVPQARSTWQNRHDVIRLAAISELTQWLMLIGYVLWGFFGVLSASLWVAAPSAVSVPLAIATIVIVRRGRRLPAQRSVSIMSTSEPESVDATTGSVPIVSSDASVAVGDGVPSTATGAVTIISTDEGAVAPHPVAREVTATPFTTTEPIPVLT